MRSHTCDRCCGNGEIVTDWDRYKHPRPGDVGDEAVAECPDCGGEGIIDEGDEDACVMCGQHLEAGDPVYWSINDDGHMHAGCTTSYVDDDGKETDVPPEPMIFRPDATPTKNGGA